MSEPWGDNSRPDEGCGFCSDFARMKDDAEVCEGCPHEPLDADLPVSDEAVAASSKWHDAATAVKS